MFGMRKIVPAVWKQAFVLAGAALILGAVICFVFLCWYGLSNLTR